MERLVRESDLAAALRFADRMTARLVAREGGIADQVGGWLVADNLGSGPSAGLLHRSGMVLSGPAIVIGAGAQPSLGAVRVGDRADLLLCGPLGEGRPVFDLPGFRADHHRLDRVPVTIVGRVPWRVVEAAWRRRRWLSACCVVAAATTYLGSVREFAQEQLQHGRRVIDFPECRRHLALASTALSGAGAVLERTSPDSAAAEGATAAILTAADQAVARAGRVHAARSVQSSVPATVAAARLLDRRLSPSMPTGHLPPAPLADHAAATRTALADAGGRTAAPAGRRWLSDLIRRLPSSADASSHAQLAEAAACADLLDSGVAAGLLTHRQVVASYLRHAQGGNVRSHWYPAARRGEAVAAIAISEPSGSSDLRGLRTTLDPHQDGFRLSGHKTFCVNGADCDVLVVAAQLGGRVALVAVDAAAPTVTRTRARMSAWRGVDFADLAFDDHWVPAEDIIARSGLALLLAGTVLERVNLAVQQVVRVRQWLTSDVLRGRHDLVDHWRWVAGLVEHVADRFDPARLPAAEASMAKLAANNLALQAATAACESDVHSGEDVVGWLCDARAELFAAGTPEINHEIVADAVARTGTVMAL